MGGGIHEHINCAHVLLFNILGNIHCEKNWDISMQCQMYFFVSCCI